jgi:hypothetical protein
MTYHLGAKGKQYVVITAGGLPRIAEESLSDASVAELTAVSPQEITSRSATNHADAV